MHFRAPPLGYATRCQAGWRRCLRASRRRPGRHKRSRALALTGRLADFGIDLGRRRGAPASRREAGRRCRQAFVLSTAARCFAARPRPMTMARWAFHQRPTPPPASLCGGVRARQCSIWRRDVCTKEFSASRQNAQRCRDARKSA